jgi:hypothetical protein
LNLGYGVRTSRHKTKITHYGVEGSNGEGTSVTQDVVSDILELNKMVLLPWRALTGWVAYNAIADVRIQSFSHPRYEHVGEWYHSGCGW